MRHVAQMVRERASAEISGGMKKSRKRGIFKRTFTNKNIN